MMKRSSPTTPKASDRRRTVLTSYRVSQSFDLKRTGRYATPPRDVNHSRECAMTVSYDHKRIIRTQSNPGPRLADGRLRILVEQLAVGEGGAIEVPRQQLLQCVSGRLAMDRQDPQLRSGARMVPHARDLHELAQERVRPGRLVLKILDEVGQDRGAARAVQEVDLAHDPVADHDLIELACRQ